MGVFKIKDGTGAWIPIVGNTGPVGPTGPTGIDSTVIGPTGPTGTIGPGLAAGGTPGQMLSKVDATDYNTTWATPVTPALDQVTADALYVNVVGDTMTGSLTVDTAITSAVVVKNSAAAAYVELDAQNPAAESWAGIRPKRQGVSRWVFGKETTAETGSNTGSYFGISRFDDAGTQGSRAFTINRANCVTVMDSDLGISAPLNDTGWREIKTLINNGWTVSGLAIRRQGNACTMRISGLSPAGATHANFVTAMPSGFQMYVPYPRDLIGTANSGNTVVRQVVGASATSIQVPQYAGSSNTSALSGMIHWFTADPWPVSLPGTPL